MADFDDRDEFGERSGEESEGESLRLPPLRVMLSALLVIWAVFWTAWFTSERSNFPLPLPIIQMATSGLLSGEMPTYPEGTNFLDLYGVGAPMSLLQTYTSLIAADTWSHAFIAWETIDWIGHVEAILAIVLYTLLGLCALGALGVKWPWPTRLAVAYAMGVGVGGWVFEQWAIPHWLNRWTVLGSLAVLFGALGWLWKTSAAMEPPATSGEPDVGKAHAVAALDAGFRGAAWVLLGILVALSFWHAVTLPPTNWDGLILYLGYAQKTHVLGGFPVKVCAQVGIGLGANYPHLYEVTQAAITRLGGHWTPLVGQWAVPWASLCATVLVYALAHRAFRRRDLALIAALIFRCSPEWISFSQLASNYPLATLMAAGVLLTGHDWLMTGDRRHAVAMLLLAAFASHVNYLMPALWGIALLALALRFAFELTHPQERLPNRRAPKPRRWGGLIIALGLTLAMAGSWYLRNWIVTGNPVYAFFPEILGGRNINLDVLASADVEWRANGDGIGRLTSLTGHHTFIGNLLSLPRFLLLEPSFRWKLAPLFEALALPGLIMLLGGMFAWRRWSVFEGIERVMWWSLPLALFLGLWFYHVALADYYLYQIIPMLVPAALFATIPLMLSGVTGGVLRGLLLAVVLLIALPMSLMGFKVKGFQDQMNLWALTHPFAPRDIVYARVYPLDVLIWEELERNWRGAVLLTHDNRHLIYDPLVEIVHLDDWDVQPIYEIEDPQDRLDFWRERGVDLYLRIPNEANHVANSWAGMQALIDRGDLRLIRRTTDQATGEQNRLYAFPWAEQRREDD